MHGCLDVVGPDREHEANVVLLSAQKITRAKIAHMVAMRHAIMESCNSLPFTILLAVLFLFMVWLHSNVVAGFEATSAMAASVSSLAVAVPASPGHKHLGNASRVVRLGTMVQMDDALKWLDLGLVPLIRNEGSSIPELREHFLVFNKALGAIHLKQTRSVSQGLCPVAPPLRKFYGNSCANPDSEAAEPFGAYASDRAFQPTKDGTFVTWLDLRSTKDSLHRRLRHLRDNNWLDSQTETLSIEVAFLNAEQRLYVVLRVTFVTSRSGDLHYAMSLDTVVCDPYSDTSYAVPDLLWITLILILVHQEMRQLARSYTEGALSNYLRDPWNVVDWLTMLFGFGVAWTWFAVVQATSSLAAAVSATAHLAPAVALWEATQVSVEQVAAEREHHDTLSNLSQQFREMDTLITTHALVAFWYLMIITARFFKGFQGQPRIALISETIRVGFSDVLHWLVIFSLLFLNFAVGGHLLFGVKMHQWSSLHLAVNSTLRALIGDFSYEELAEWSPALASIWFCLWIVSAYMLVLNLFLAIIVDTYGSVRRGLGPGLGLAGQAKQVFLELEWIFSYEGSRRRHPTSHSLLEALLCDQHHLRSLLSIRNSVFAVRSDPGSRRQWALMDNTESIDSLHLQELGVDEDSAVRLIRLTREAMDEIEFYGEDMLDRLSVSAECELRRVRGQLSGAQAQLRDWHVDALSTLREVTAIQSECMNLARSVVNRSQVPAGWTTEKDEVTGEDYYVNLETGMTSWSLPRR